MKGSPGITTEAQEQTSQSIRDGSASESSSRTQLARVAHHRILVLVIALIATLGAAGYAALQGSTYTGTSALTVASGSGNPTADAAVAQGYVEYFNQVFAKSPTADDIANASGADLSARTSATSSIVYISATTTNAEQAARSAEAAAQAFRDTVNVGLQQNVDRTVADLTKQLDAVKRGFGSEPASQSGLVSAQIDSLQNEIVQIQSTGSRNQLQDLKLDPVVLTSTPQIALNAGLGLAGGLILGVVVALVLGGIDDRLFTPEDVRRRLGLDTLASITARTGRLRAVQLRRLAAVVGLASTKPATLAVASVRRTTASGQIAEWVAAARAQQGQRTLLINADLDANRSESERRPGLGAFLTQPALELQALVVPGAVQGMLVLPAGNTAAADPYGPFRPDRVDELVKQASQLADVVVIATPPCAENPEAHAICAVADRTVLVLEKGAVRARDAVEVCAGLERVHATVWGAVIADARVGADQAPAAPGPVIANPPVITDQAPAAPAPVINDPRVGTDQGPAAPAPVIADPRVGTDQGPAAPGPVIADPPVGTDQAPVASGPGYSQTAERPRPTPRPRPRPAQAEDRSNGAGSVEPADRANARV